MNPAPLLAVLAVGAAGLRQVSPLPEAATHTGDTDSSQGQAELKAEAQDDSEHVPRIKTFAREWTDLTNKTTGHVEALPDIKLVLGVFTTVHEEAYREVIRNTWMHQTGVCSASLGPRPECSVYTTFVQAGVKDQPFDETLALPVPENMNGGKSFRYFRRALGHFPWATHYGKMDMDVFPYLPVILHSIKQVHSGCEAFLGKPWSCKSDPHKTKHCPSRDCGPPQDGSFSNRASYNSDTCWSYMQGGLYILSHMLASHVAAPGGYGDFHSSGPEDVMMGRAVFHIMKRENICVDTWSRETALPNVAYFHAQKGLPCVNNSMWCEYYRTPLSAAAASE